MHHDEMSHAGTAEKNEKVSHLHSLVKKLQFAMLTTTSEKGTGLRSRPMTLQLASDESGDLWFFVAYSSPPARDVVLHPQVNVAFSNPETNEYVSVTGEAELVRDPAKAKELWNPIYKAWFPRGLKDPELALLRVKVHEADYWETGSSKATQLLGLAKALLTGRRGGAELGERRHIDGGDLRAG